MLSFFVLPAASQTRADEKRRGTFLPLLIDIMQLTVRFRPDTYTEEMSPEK